MRKKLYLIILTNFKSEILVILGIKVITKLNNIINQIKPSKT